MASKRERGNPLGPTSRAVSANVKRIRRERGETLEGLSRELAARGQFISDSALSKLERGVRRVEVDDLTALAAVLGVTPTDLLLPSGVEAPLLTGLPEGLSTDDVDAWLLGKTELTHEALAEYWLHEADRTLMFMTADLTAYKAARTESDQKHYLERVQMQQARVARDRARAVEHLQAAGVLGDGQGYEDIPTDYLPGVIDLSNLGGPDA